MFKKNVFVNVSKFKHFKRFNRFQWLHLYGHWYDSISSKTAFIICLINLLKISNSLVHIFFIHLKACNDGYFGINCGYTCPDLYFGKRCILRCNCSIGHCHHVHGCMTSRGNYYLNYTIPHIYDDALSRKLCEILINTSINDFSFWILGPETHDDISMRLRMSENGTCDFFLLKLKAIKAQ